jgi:hypothetical protein
MPHPQKCIDVASIPLVNPLRQIVLDTYLFDLIELGFDPVDVILFFLQDRLEKHFGVIISNLRRQMGTFAVTTNSRLFGSRTYSCIFGTSAPMII